MEDASDNGGGGTRSRWPGSNAISAAEYLDEIYARNDAKKAGRRKGQRKLKRKHASDDTRTVEKLGGRNDLARTTRVATFWGRDEVKEKIANLSRTASPEIVKIAPELKKTPPQAVDGNEEGLPPDVARARERRGRDDIFPGSSEPYAAANHILDDGDSEVATTALPLRQRGRSNPTHEIIETNMVGNVNGDTDGLSKHCRRAAPPTLLVNYPRPTASVSAIPSSRIPSTRTSTSPDAPVAQACSNCRSVTTRSWCNSILNKDRKFCFPCYQYERKHSKARPLELEARR
ncbi:hypothetical protein B0H19DRAFT_1370896, partial [Mycena capillaripes]